MTTPLQLNTGKLLSDSYTTLLALNTTLSSTNENVTTGNIKVQRKSIGSVIQITMFLEAAITTGAGIGDRSLSVLVFRNNDTTLGNEIFNKTIIALSDDNLSGLGFDFAFSFIDKTPSSGAPITGEPIIYDIQFRTTGLGADDEISLGPLDLLTFEEIENPNELTLTTPLTPFTP